MLYATDTTAARICGQADNIPVNLGKTKRTSLLSHPTRTRSASCPHWTAISWRAQVRETMFDDHQFDRFV